MIRLRSKTLLCLVVLFFSLSFCFSSFAVGNGSDAGEKSYFTETDDFKVFTRNQIYLYEPCETLNEGVGDISGNDEFGFDADYLYVGSAYNDKDPVEQKILSAGHSFGLTSHIPVGVLAGVQTLVGETTNLKDYNPLEVIGGKIGYLKWSEDEFKDLKKVILSEPRFADYSETLKDFYDNPRNPSGDSDALDKLIAAEFFYYHYKYPKVNPGENPQDDDKITEDIQAAGDIFIHARNSSLSVSTTIAKKFKPYYEDLENEIHYINESFLKINLKSADTANFLTSTLIIGDSLVYRSESDNEGDVDGKHYNGRALTSGDNAPLKGFTTENINATDGRTFAEGLEILDSYSNSSIKYLIYALGNNNCQGEGSRCESSAPPLTESDLSNVVSKAREKFGESVYIFFLTSYRAVEGDGSDYGSLAELSNNALVNNFASSDDKVRIINWASSVKSNPEKYLWPDGHPKMDGSILLGKLFKNTLSSAQTDYEYDRDKAPCPNRTDGREDVEVGSGDEDGGDFFDTPTDGDDSSGGGTDGGSGGGDGSGSSGRDSSGPRNVPISKYFNQNDSKWKNIQWKGGSCPNCTIGYSGCPMVSVINALYAQGYDVNPKSAATLMSNATNNFSKRISGLFKSDSDWSNVPEKIVPWYVNKAGASIQTISSSQISSKLSQGYSIVIHGKRLDSVSTNCYGKKNSECIFTKGGHVIAIVGVKNGKWLVANPGNGGNREISPNDVINTTYTQYKHIWAIKRQ